MGNFYFNLDVSGTQFDANHFLNAILYDYHSFLLGAGSRRGMQLPKCVHSHRLSAAKYITQT